MRPLKYCAIPVFVHVVIALTYQGLVSAMMQFAMETVIVPIYLVTVNYHLLVKDDMLSLSKRFVLMLLVIMLTHAIDYLAWGVYSGWLMNPDSETVLVVEMTATIAIAVLSVGWAVACWLKKKPR